MISLNLFIENKTNHKLFNSIVNEKLNVSRRLAKNKTIHILN